MPFQPQFGQLDGLGGQLLHVIFAKALLASGGSFAHRLGRKSLAHRQQAHRTRLTAGGGFCLRQPLARGAQR